MLIPHIALTGLTDSTTIATAISLLIYNPSTTTSLTPRYFYNVGITGSPVWERFVTDNHYVGENFGGGIVIYVYDNEQHGLVSATINQAIQLAWNNSNLIYNSFTGDGLGAGEMNTAMIEATQMADNQTDNFYAKAAADYSITVDSITYGDWYLPSAYELNILCEQKNLLTGWLSGFYWSSPEVDDEYAYVRHFGKCSQDNESKDFTGNVRAIRAF